jgi:hypothetical protein
MCLQVQLQTWNLDTVMRVHCCGELITRLPQIGNFFTLLWDTFILLVSVVFRPVMWVPALSAYLQINGRWKIAQILIFSKLVKFVTWVSVLRFFFTLRHVINSCLLAAGLVEQRGRIRYSNRIMYGLEDRRFIVHFPPGTRGIYSERPDRL